MAILEEANLLAERARHAKHRTHHVGTKLNEHELHEFEALAERRKQTPSELIRGLVLGEIERDPAPSQAVLHEADAPHQAAGVCAGCEDRAAPGRLYAALPQKQQSLRISRRLCSLTGQELTYP